MVSAQTRTTFDKEKKEISAMLDAFNVAAAKADYNTYFSYFADESTFIGTDATEIWDKKHLWSGQNHISIKRKHGILPL